MGAPNPLKPPTVNGGNAFNPLGLPKPGGHLNPLNPPGNPFGGGGHNGQPLNGLGNGLNGMGHGNMNSNPITGDGMYHPENADPMTKSGLPNPALNGFPGLGGAPNPQGYGAQSFAANAAQQALSTPGSNNLAAAFMHGMAPQNPMQDTYLNHPRTSVPGANLMTPYNGGGLGTPQMPGMGPQMPQVLPGSAPPPQPMGRAPMSGQNPMMNPMFRTR